MSERGMASAESDRRGFLRGTAAAVAAAGTGVLFSGSAYAVQAYSQTGKIASGKIPLPPVGTNIPCSMYAANVPLKLNALGALTLDFKGGINLHVRSSNTDGLTLEVVEFRVEADTSPSTPNSGTVFVLKRSNASLAPLSTVTADGQAFLRIPLTVATVDKATEQETVIASSDPAKYATLSAQNTKAFPPVNQHYGLREPVAFYAPGGSAEQGSEVLGGLEGFDVIVNHAQ
ncbi:twin-arginine translocation signal domain-containing protein [Streptomyces phaeochromogenes]|uniref:Twin-arginine translocation signal domain-containing protein n=1 Tax=Streptomyces phaeochromogenes TaxID=1923 RepID=A0ABZ1HV89_STRPH|nr:twin-arginine translocation signal domain-containing protein [Streptomyces phaeochromogenes]WSD21218.1 twin-arginine translocation signal domain-containing protein [Streptomyces phaeochromogenes]